MIDTIDLGSFYSIVDHWIFYVLLATHLCLFVDVSPLQKYPTCKLNFLIACVISAFIPIAIAIALHIDFYSQASLLVGLVIFGAVFAVNSSLHSYLIVSYADSDGVSLDVGFYYMANAMGRLIGTLLSGWVYQAYGLAACLWISAVFIGLAALISTKLPKQ